MLGLSSYMIYFSWTPREESGEIIIKRMERSREALSHIIPEFGTFKVFDILDAIQRLSPGTQRKKNTKKVTPVTLAPTEPTAPPGFMVVAAKEYGFPEGLGLLAANAGRKSFPGMSALTFSAKPETRPDPKIVSYSAFRSVIQTLAPLWDATYAQATTMGLNAKIKRGARIFGPSWICWLAPELADDFAPSDAFEIEHEPDGSVFLIATKDVFTLRNAEHLEAAMAIGAALEPVEKKLLRANLD